MAIQCEIDKSNKQVIEPTFPALYIWNKKGQYFGEIHLFTNKNTSTILFSPDTERSGGYSPVRNFCTCDCWRRLAIGERIFLENSD